MKHVATFLLLVLLAGCSTKPRDFKPNIAVAPVNQDVQMRDFAVCKMMVDRGVTGNFTKQAAALAPGTAGVSVGASIAYTNSIVNAFSGGAATTAAGSTTLATALPIVGAAASIAIAAAVKSSNEKKMKSALGTCMKEYGHDVTTWQRDRSKMSELPAELPRDPAKLDK